MISSTTFIGLINNGALLVALVLVYDVMVQHRLKERIGIEQVLLGLGVGIIGVFIMMNPWELRPGIIFDTRTVLISTAGLFFGTLPTMAAAVVLGGYRIFLGGQGALAGVATILATGAVGLLWRHLQKKPLHEIQGMELYLFGLITHAAMLLCMFLLPLPVAFRVLQDIGLPVILVLPLLTFLLGKIMTRRIKRSHDAETLIENENKYSTIFLEHAAVKLLIDPEKGKIVDANRAAEKFYGWSREQLCHMTIDQINTYTPEETKEAMARAVSQDRNYFEFRHRLANGKIRDVEVFSSAVTINNTTYLHSIIHDVTARKQTESQLEETRAILQAAMDNSQAGIAIADAPDGKLRYVNRAGLFIRGGDENNLVKGVDINTYVNTWQLLDLDGIPLQAEEVPLTRAVLYGERCSREFIIRNKENNDHTVLANAAPITDDTGKITAGIVVFLDITERKQIEQELARQKRLFETMFITIPDGVVITDTDRKIVHANKGMQTTFGYRPEELIGQTTELLYQDRRTYLQAGQNAFDENAPQNNQLYITSYKKSDGRIFPGETFGAKLYDDKGNWLGNLGVMRDISERQREEEERMQLQKQLMQAQKMEAIGTLAGGIAHDFNNILGVILGYAEMASEATAPGSRMEGDINHIITAGIRAKDLVKQILTFSRESKTDLASLEPTTIVKEVLKLLRATLPSTITIKHNISNTDNILANPTRLHQVAMNLCTNAFHALEDKGGTLTLELNQVVLDTDDLRENQHISPGSFVHLAIIDDGPGIPPAIRNKIFEPYFTTKELGRGTGMGLAIVHGIVRDCGGFIRCESELGKGTVFHVYLPAITAASAAQSEEHPLIGGNEHILVIDDEPELAALIKTMVMRLGYSATISTQSVEALAVFADQAEEFDLVITDQTMPGMTGITLAQKMLELRPDIPIILCTGFSSTVNREKALAAGIKGFAEKPLVKRKLGTLIRQVLDEPKVQHATSSSTEI